jgi:hypothetical protein
MKALKHDVLFMVLAVITLPLWLPLALLGGWFFTTDKSNAEKEVA